MIKRFLALTFFLALIPFVFSQDKYTISGYVKEASSGESLIGASVYDSASFTGTTTNQYGFFSITLPKGNYTLKVSYLGYKEFSQIVELNSATRINIDLIENSTLIEEVVISADRKDNTESTQMSVDKLDIDQIKALPVLFGEVDILKTIQLLPGIQSAGEGNSGFYVRGGGPDQNLVLLDGATVYNTGHLLGFFSVFNADAINDVKVIKGGVPANYGGRLSSVVDIQMKEGNNKKYEATGGIGLIASRLTVEGPIQKNKSSFIVSGRRTYIDQLVKPFAKDSSALDGSGYYFYDLNAKMNYIFSDKDRVFASGYFGRDVFSFSGSDGRFSFSLPYGNSTATVRWNHLFSDKLFLNTTAIFNDYQFEIEAGQNDFKFKLFSGVEDYSGKLDFEYFPNVRNNVKFGAHYTYHIFTPSSASAQAGEIKFEPEKINKQYANEYAGYIQDDITVTDRIKLNAGLRYSYFEQIGPYDLYEVDDVGTPTDTQFYERGEKIASYGGFEPRISTRIKLNKESSIKVAYTFSYQYLHLAAFGGGNLPADLWIPSSAKIKPQESNQYAVGYFRNFNEDKYETSVEVYYKDMLNLVEFVETPTSAGINENIENQLTLGQGYSYGLELFIKKKFGKLNGWIGYTWSKSNRQFDDLNFGEEFPARYDRRHDASVVGTYELNKRWSFSSVFVFGSGSAYSVPSNLVVIAGQPSYYYGENYRNSLRFKPYHRLDISATLKGKTTKKFESSWNFSVYNVYNRFNQYIVYLDLQGNINDPGGVSSVAKEVGIFRILPSVAWNFKF
ncbi:MAG: hypothetical protein ACJAZ3_001221 [Sphingobacteriales bacterium]|jgi:hypothetical protein